MLPLGEVLSPGRRSGREAGQRGSVGLELLLMAPVLTGLVLLVLWSAESGRGGLTATLAAEEAAVAAGEMCETGSGIDAGCAVAVAEQVVAGRTLPSAGCVAQVELFGGESADMPGRAVAVEVACESGAPAASGIASGASGVLHSATGVHLPNVDFEIVAAGSGDYTGDRPTDPALCFGGSSVDEPYPERPTVRGPGNADLSWLQDLVIWSLVVPADGRYRVACARLPLSTAGGLGGFSHDFVMAVWTEDVRDSSFGFIKPKAGDTCENYQQTGVKYLRIPKEHPQYMRLSPADERPGSNSDNRRRSTTPFGLCGAGSPSVDRWGGWDYYLAGVFELHIEIVSGGTGHAHLLCDGERCYLPKMKSDLDDWKSRCLWVRWLNSKRAQPEKLPSLMEGRHCHVSVSDRSIVERFDRLAEQELL